MQKTKNVIDILGKIKNLKRTGWKRKDIYDGESVADHIFGVCFLVLMLCPKELDCDKCLKMAVIHDLQEAYVGDYTPFDTITHEEKSLLERQAAEKISQELEFPELIDWFEEFENNQTPEARFVKDVDRLEAVLQAKYYDEHLHSNNKSFPEFYSYAITHLNDDTGIAAQWIKKLAGADCQNSV